MRLASTYTPPTLMTSGMLPGKAKCPFPAEKQTVIPLATASRTAKYSGFRKLGMFVPGRSRLYPQLFVITCGLPGREMPAFDRRAYTDDRCLGRTRADLERMGLSLPDPAATLQPREIERLADFLLTKVVGQGEMDHAKCVDLWGEDVNVCSELP